MPDRLIPPRWRIVLRIARSVLHALVVAAGVSGIVWTPRTIVGTIGEPLTLWWTSLATLGGLAALAGVVADRWTVEWLALWPATGGLVGYAVTVWGIAATGELTRITQASVITGLAVALAYRGLELGAHAAMLRTEHRSQQLRR